MNTVFKYPLQGARQQKISLPKGAHILSVQEQNGVPTIWACVDPNERTVERMVYVVGTGEPVPYHGEGVPVYMGSSLHYIGTVLLQGGALVYHVFIEQESVPLKVFI